MFCGCTESLKYMAMNLTQERLNQMLAKAEEVGACRKKLRLIRSLTPDEALRATKKHRILKML